MRLKIIGSGGCVSIPRRYASVMFALRQGKKAFLMQGAAAVCMLRMPRY